MRPADHRARLRSNAAWLLLGRIGTQALLVLFTIVIARRLGEVGLGEYAFVASAVVVANVVTTFGTDMLLVREIAARRGRLRAGAALAIQLALSVAFIALVFALAPALPNQSADVIRALKIYVLALLPLAAFTVCTSALRGLGLMGTYTLLNLAVSSVQVAVALLFVQPGTSIVSLALLLLGTQLVAAALGVALCGARIPDLWSGWRRRDIAALARASAPIALLAALGMLYQRSTFYLLSTLAGAGATGLYAAGQRAVEASKIAHLAGFGALYQAFAQMEADASPPLRVREPLARPLWVLLVIAVLAAATLTLLAAPIVTVLYGPAFASSVEALRVLAWVLVPYTFTGSLSLALVAARREAPVARALAASLVALVLLDLWLIPSIGLLGACWAALAAETLQAIMLLVAHGIPDLSR